MAKENKKVFDGIYAQLEETDGNVVLFDAKGAPSVIFEMTNPVLRLCTDSERYMVFQDHCPRRGLHAKIRIPQAE